MFDEDINYADIISFVLCDDTLPNIGTEIRAKGGTVASGECSECNGTIYDYRNEVVCGNCSLVIGSETRETSMSRWQYFRENRPSYHNSNKDRVPGSFPDAYDWVKREDIDRPVKKVEPELFYDG